MWWSSCAQQASGGLFAHHPADDPVGRVHPARRHLPVAVCAVTRAGSEAGGSARGGPAEPRAAGRGRHVPRALRAQGAWGRGAQEGPCRRVSGPNDGRTAGRVLFVTFVGAQGAV